MKLYTITLAGLPISFIPKVNVGADGWSSDSLHHFISIVCSTGRLEVGSSRVGGIVQELLPCGEIARLPHVQQRPQPSLAEAKKVAEPFGPSGTDTATGSRGPRRSSRRGGSPAS